MLTSKNYWSVSSKQKDRASPHWKMRGTGDPSKLSNLIQKLEKSCIFL